MSIYDNYGAAFDEAFKREYDNTSLAPSFVELEAGRYQFGVVDVRITDQGNTRFDGLQPDQYYDNTLAITLKVLNEGPYKGCMTHKYDGICLANVKRIKGDLVAMGHEFEGMAKLIQAVEDGSMIGLIVDGRVTKRNGKTGKVYTNVWLDRCVGRMSEEQMGGGFTPADDDEDLPWG